MTRDLATASKFLSYVLRHRPDTIGLKLDPEGWAAIDELLAKADIPLDADTLQRVVGNSDKKRFAISADGMFIRVNQGHSVAVDLGLPPVEPPALLYNGTASRFLDAIFTEGLQPQSRQYVHLSQDEVVAVEVGRRYGKPVVLQVAAPNLHRNGHAFFRADNGVWLTRTVPAPE